MKSRKHEKVSDLFDDVFVKKAKVDDYYMYCIEISNYKIGYENADYFVGYLDRFIKLIHILMTMQYRLQFIEQIINGQIVNQSVITIGFEKGKEYKIELNFKSNEQLSISEIRKAVIESAPMR